VSNSYDDRKPSTLTHLLILITGALVFGLITDNGLIASLLFVGVYTISAIIYYKKLTHKLMFTTLGLVILIFALWAAKEYERVPLF